MLSFGNPRRVALILCISLAAAALASGQEASQEERFRQLMQDPEKRAAFFKQYFPEPSFDATAPELPAELEPGGVLIFSKTNGFRDHAAIDAANAALSAMAERRGWPQFQTENGAVMNAEQLQQFKIVVWNNTSGDTLTEEQRAAFRSWVEGGGVFFGIHGAGGDPAPGGPIFSPPRSAAAWDWYVNTLLGAQFVVHSPIVPGVIRIEDTKSPITAGLPETWERSDEWYAFAENPRSKPGFHVLATVDETSYQPEGPASMGADHPLIWQHCVGKGHALYSALGHGAEMYAEPLMIRLLENAVAWGRDQSGQTCAAGL